MNFWDGVNARELQVQEKGLKSREIQVQVSEQPSLAFLSDAEQGSGICSRQGAID